MKLVTIATFNYIHDLAILKGRLEAEGIQCYVKDEYTMQTNPGHMSAIGGIKLQVGESDVEAATDILIALGYLKLSVAGPDIFWQNFEKYTSHIPLLKKLPLVIRLLIIVVLLAAMVIIGLLIYYGEL